MRASAIHHAALVGLTAAIAAALLAPAAAHAQSDECLSADPPPVDSPAKRLRFGITPQLAGSAGGTQGEVAPEYPGAAVRALKRLEPPRRRLVIRLNRLFMSDGQAGIDRFAKLAERYRRAGFAIESQVRYHPAPEQEGDMDAWQAFARAAARRLGRNPALVALSITNEVNLPISSNTSDGAYAGALDAIALGIPAVRDELDRLGRPDVKLGFTYAWRYIPGNDNDFWQGIGDRATPAFLAATDYVGVQLYPGLFWPPAFSPGETAGDATLEALTVVRDCYMPKAKLGSGVELWVSENGYATNLNRSEVRQINDLRSTIDDVHGLSGTLGVTDYRYFNLRDNRSQGSDIFDAVGLLRDNYAEKGAFGLYRDLISRYGRDDHPRLRLTTRCRRGGLKLRVRGRDAGTARRVVFRLGGRRVRVDRRFPFTAFVRGSALRGRTAARLSARVALADGRRPILRRRPMGRCVGGP